jgi:hypothetical protein
LYQYPRDYPIPEQVFPTQILCRDRTLTLNPAIAISAGPLDVFDEPTGA